MFGHSLQLIELDDEPQERDTLPGLPLQKIWKRIHELLSERVGYARGECEFDCRAANEFRHAFRVARVLAELGRGAPWACSTREPCT
eukprot:scaffold5807_cov412-Prasinococcus_capsulatus_cf.AAC.5